MGVLQNQMLRIHEDVNRRNFNNSLKKGHRLTVDELRNLKSTLKKDYFRHMLGIDDDVQNLISNTNVNAKVVHE